MIISHLLLVLTIVVVVIVVAGTSVDAEEDAAYYFKYDNSINDEEYNYNPTNYYYDELVSVEDRVGATVEEDLEGMEKEIDEVYEEEEEESYSLYYPSCMKADGALYDHRSGDDGFYGGYLEPYEFEEYCCPDSIRGWNPKTNPQHDPTKTTTTKCRRREQADDDDDVIDDDNAVDAAVYDMLETEEGEEGTYTSHLEPCEFKFYRAAETYYDDDTISPYDPSFSVDFCSDANLIVDGYNEMDGSELITIRTEYVYMWKDECVGQFKQCYSIPADEYIYLDYVCYHEWTFPKDATHMSVSCTNDRQSKIEYIQEHRDEDNANIRDYWDNRDEVFYDDDGTNDNDNVTNNDSNGSTKLLFRKPRWDDAVYALLGAFVLWVIAQCWARRCYYCGSSSSSTSSPSEFDNLNGKNRNAAATVAAVSGVPSITGRGGRRQRVLRLPRRAVVKGRKLRGTGGGRRQQEEDAGEEVEEMILYLDNDDNEETSNQMSNLNDEKNDRNNDIDTNRNETLRVVQID